MKEDVRVEAAMKEAVRVEVVVLRNRPRLSYRPTFSWHLKYLSQLVSKTNLYSLRLQNRINLNRYIF
jgi:hypothetical protein